MSLSTVEEAIQDFKSGKMVIIVDDEDRENEGDLAIAADYITPEAVNFMATYGRGLICISLTGDVLDKLEIPMMVPSSRNGSGFGTGFTISVEAREGVTTGISAHDRAHTIKVLIDPESTARDIVMPGHIFPLRAKSGGVLERGGQTEASMDLARLSGRMPAGVICEIMSKDGSMARLPELEAFSKTHDIKIVSVEAIKDYIIKKSLYNKSTTSINNGIIRGATTDLPTQYGVFNATAYIDLENSEEHLAIHMGDLTEYPPLVRMHSSCLTGDVIGSYRCDCGEQLHMALDRISKNGSGLLIYLRQEGRGIGLANKIRAYTLQSRGLDTVDANLHLGFSEDARSYAVAASILKDLNVDTIRLMTNNPRKIEELTQHNIRVMERISNEIPARPENIAYLTTKAKRMGHHLDGLG